MKKHITYILLFLNLNAFSQDSESANEITSALTILNNARIAAGLDTVSISVTFSRGCYSHAKYLVTNKNNPLTNGMNAHKEFPELQGYSKDGEIAGKSAVIHFVKLSQAVDGWIQTFYHRVPLLQPNLKEIGIASYEIDGYTVSLLDCISGTKGESSKDVVFYPNENQSNVPTTMGLEIPDPVGKEGKFGFPITIYFTRWQKVVNVDFKLTDNNGKEIACYVSSPEKPATYFSQWNSICAIAMSPLLGDTKYFVTVTCIVNGQAYKKTYNFQTTKT